MKTKQSCLLATFTLSLPLLFLPAALADVPPNLAVGDAAGNLTLLNLESGAILKSTNLNATAIARLDPLDVDGDHRSELLATHFNAPGTPTTCLTLPALGIKWLTDRTTSFGWLGADLMGGPRVYAGDFARDGVLKLFIPSSDGGQIFRASDGTFESALPSGLNWYPIPFLDPVDSHWKLTSEIAPDGFTHYLCAYDLTAGQFLWTNTTVNTWLLGTVGTSMLDGTPRLWGGWYGRTLYVTDRNGVELWRKSFGGGYEAAGVYAGDLLGNGTEMLLVAGTPGSHVQVDAARLSDGQTIWTFTDSTAHWSAQVIAIGDADADGDNEVVLWSNTSASAGQPPKYQVLNGANGTRLWQQSYAYDAWMIQHARLADVNNDGRKEVLLAVNNTIEARDANTGVLVKTYSVITNVTTFELVPGEPASPCERIAQLGEQIVAANLPAQNIRPLLASLEAACASVARSNATAAVNQLEAFQHKVRAQVAKKNPALAAQWIQAAQRIIEQLLKPELP